MPKAITGKPEDVLSWPRLANERHKNTSLESAVFDAQETLVSRQVSSGYHPKYIKTVGKHPNHPPFPPHSFGDDSWDHRAVPSSKKKLEGVVFSPVCQCFFSLSPFSKATLQNSIGVVCSTGGKMAAQNEISNGQSICCNSWTEFFVLWFCLLLFCFMKNLIRNPGLPTP